MKKEEFLKYVEHEINWLKYYARKDTREKLTVNSNLYKDLISIGYAKRYTPLPQRCAGCILTADKNITSEITIEDLYISYALKNNEENRYTPLEIFWMKFPNERINILQKLI